MKYNKKSLSAILRSHKTVFTFKDISLIWGNCDQKSTIAGVNYYVKKGELHRLRRGIYVKDNNYNPFELATRIFTPSYVSFETVLVKSGINFQFSSEITVATYQTRQIIIEQSEWYHLKFAIIFCWLNVVCNSQ